jgi:hypothetical protein
MTCWLGLQIAHLGRNGKGPSGKTRTYRIGLILEILRLEVENE